MRSKSPEEKRGLRGRVEPGWGQPEAMDQCISEMFSDLPEKGPRGTRSRRREGKRTAELRGHFGGIQDLSGVGSTQPRHRLETVTGTLGFQVKLEACLQTRGQNEVTILTLAT